MGNQFRVKSATPSVWALHASASNATQWTALARQLSSTYSFMAPELPGYRGPAMRGPLGLARKALPVVDMIEKGGTPVHLVGHSMGGAVALKIAAMRPDLVASLALYEPMLPTILGDRINSEERRALGAINAVAARLSATVACGVPEEGMAGFIDFWNGAGTWSSLGPKLRKKLSAQAMQVVSDFNDMSVETLGAAETSSIKVPVLLMSGTHSPAVTQQIARRLVSSLPDVAHVELHGAGHMAPVEQFQWINTLIAAALQRVDQLSLPMPVAA